MSLDDIIYGKNKETNIVNISIKDDVVHIFKEYEDGVYVEERPYKHWVLTPKKLDGSSKLAGDQHYRFYKEFDSTKAYFDAKKDLYKHGMYTAHNFTENFMLRHGYTYFKGMKPSEVSMLSFDIETTGLDPEADDAQVLLVTNTYRKGDYYESRTFCVNDYPSDNDMLLDWAGWVCELDPSVLLGHNIVIFDIPYILKRCPALPIGRYGVELTLDGFSREFRKDGSQTYTYHRVNCFGREVVDTFFVAIKADISRKYENYRLKGIIKQEGLEEEGRQHYEAALIKKNWHDPEERKKIVSYAEADSRDPLKLFDLMIPTFFYLCPYVPKPFQIITESATGSQLNSMIVRAYLQQNNSVAKASDTGYVQGGISFAIPGIYRNLWKVDIKSAYPSQILRLKLYSKEKDPEQYFYKIAEYFTNQRFEYKKKSKETGDQYWMAMDSSTKVLINSLYGLTQTGGLNYNDPTLAEIITEETRKVINLAITWGSGKDANYWMNIFKEKTDG